MERTYTDSIRKLYTSLNCYKVNTWIPDIQRVTSQNISNERLSAIFDDALTMSWIEYHNSVKNETIRVEALDFIFGVFVENDILIENGMIMKNGRLVNAPTVQAEMYLYNRRKVTKTKGNYYLTTGDDPVLGAIYDNLQKNIKILMNTYYGVLTNPYSVFYNRDLGDSITCRGRSSIAVTALACEGAFAKRIPYEINALLYYFTQCYMTNNIDKDVLAEMMSYNYTYHDVIREFNLESHYALPYIIKKLENLNPEQIACIIYKNNFELFINLPTIRSTIIKFYKLCSDAEIPYLDPNEPPSSEIDGEKVYVEGTAELMRKLEEYTRTILTGMYWYGEDYLPDKDIYTHNVQDVIKSMDRHVIAIIDTDSNILSYEDQYKAIEKLLTENNLIGAFEEDNEFYSISNMCAIITCEVIAESLVVYKKSANLMPEKWDCLRLKNEFLFSKVLMSRRKKHYLSVVKLKEGQAYPQPKLANTGHEYKKSSVNVTIGERVKSLVELVMMSDTLDIPNILSTLRKYTLEVEEAHGTQRILDYCVTLKLKTTFEKTDPSDYRYKAITLWNSLATSDSESIAPPAAFRMIPIDLHNHVALAERYPVEMSKIYKWLDDRNAMMIRRQLNEILSDEENSKYGFMKLLVENSNIEEITSVDEWKRIRKNTLQIKKINKVDVKTCDLSYIEIEDIDKIAFPLTVTTVPQFILDIVEPMDNKILVNSLFANIISELHIQTARNSKSKKLVTNIIDRF